ncbi:hypothetical protein [Amycolatopsis pigmentata]|uniref:Uncharacterized protein n=1 Tax=Amycolatopsis pigmentata TaxID=450801 RepID=A0ABW5G008_9PSEU
MTAVITTRDETASLTATAYHYTRIVEIAGHTLRAHVERGRFDHSIAVVDVLNDHLTWTPLIADAASNWWYSTHAPHATTDPVAVLSPIADRLLHRAADILTAPPATLTTSTPGLSPRVRDAVSALLAVTYSYDGERRIDPDDIAWAQTHGGALHILEHHDGSVTFTKQHRDACPFITSTGAQECDAECDFVHPANAKLG